MWRSHIFIHTCDDHTWHCFPLRCWSHQILMISVWHLCVLWPFPQAENVTAPPSPSTKKFWFLSHYTLPPCRNDNGSITSCHTVIKHKIQTESLHIEYCTKQSYCRSKTQRLISQGHTGFLIVVIQNNIVIKDDVNTLSSRRQLVSITTMCLVNMSALVMNWCQNLSQYHNHVCIFIWNEITCINTFEHMWIT